MAGVLRRQQGTFALTAGDPTHDIQLPNEVTQLGGNAAFYGTEVYGWITLDVILLLSVFYSRDDGVTFVDRVGSRVITPNQAYTFTFPAIGNNMRIRLTRDTADSSGQFVISLR